MAETIEQIVKELRRMPMLHFSLGGKELFHSNFLYWLATDERYKHQTYAMLKEMAGAENDKSWDENNTECRREYHHYDFSIWEKGEKDVPVLVIENKVKSIPKLKQLKNYAEEVEKKNSNPNFILLSLMSQISGGEIKGKSIGEINDGEGKTTEWRYVGYDKYRELLGKHFGDIDVSKDKGGIYIKDYCNFIEKLSELAEIWQNEFNPKNAFFDNKNIKKYEEIRMDDVYEKVRVSCFASFLKKKIKLKSEEISFGYTRNQGLVGILTDDKNKKCRLCLQIQGNEYRRCIVIENKVGKAKNEKLATRIWKEIMSDKKLKDFFFFVAPMGNNDDLSSGESNGGGKKSYNKFITNDYIFLYRYIRIKESETNEDVAKRIADDYMTIQTLSVENIRTKIPFTSASP